MTYLYNDIRLYAYKSIFMSLCKYKLMYAYKVVFMVLCKPVFI